MTAAGRETALIAKLSAAWPVESWRDVTVLVAVSGGADSVALARGLHQIHVASEGRLVLAHFNHKLRGPESDADQECVEALARELGVEIIIDSASPRPLAPPPLPSPHPSEDSLRDLRYQFLAHAANQCGAHYVATAHTADDHVETVLFNILRGTGLAGLAGIPRVRQLTEAATLIRPLLEVTRAEVLEYLQRIDKGFREDSTNSDLNYTRNRIRHELLPLLERQYNPHVRDALSRVAQIAERADDLTRGVARQHLSKLCRRIPGGIEIQVFSLQHGLGFMARPLLIEAWRWQEWPLQDMGFEQWDELTAIARQEAPARGKQVASRMFPGGIRAEREGKVLRLTRVGL